MKKRRIHKKNELGWYLFDFGNSYALTVGSIYFSKWFVEDLQNGSARLNILFTGSAATVILFGYFLGKKIDYSGLKVWFYGFSGATSLAVIVIALAAAFRLSHLPATLISSLGFIIFLTSYQSLRICHNSYLRTAIDSERQARVSGFGAAANWSGSVFGILATIPLITFISGEAGRADTLIFVAATYPCFVFPALGLMRPSAIAVAPTKAKKKPRPDLFERSSIVALLAGYLFLFDALGTVEKNLPTFLSNSQHMNDNTQGGAFLLILSFAALGGFVSAKVVETNNSWRYLLFSTILVFLGILGVALSSRKILWFSFVLAGLGYGLLTSASRLYFMQFLSPETAGRGFSIYALLERGGSIIGPIMWSISFFIFRNKEQGYKFAMLAMAANIFLAFLLLLGLRKNRFTLGSRND